jgi:hypothetical protein
VIGRLLSYRAAGATDVVLSSFQTEPSVLPWVWAVAAELKANEWMELGSLPFHFDVHPWMRELLAPGRTIVARSHRRGHRVATGRRTGGRCAPGVGDRSAADDLPSQGGHRTGSDR